MVDDWIEQKAELHIRIPFVDCTHDYGRAGFGICAVRNRGIIKHLYIYPRQQNSSTYYSIPIPDGFKPRNIWFSAYEKLADPIVWQEVWCKDHKCPSLHLSVPPESSIMSVDTCFGDTIHFEFWRK